MDDKSKGNATGAQDGCGGNLYIFFINSSLFIQYHLFNIIGLYVCFVLCVCFFVLFLFWILLLLKAIISKGLRS